ncbi:MAG: hypothetical protein EAZ06_02375 [Cytophagales bacterium]|nr:MAG: hypothetical protein EAZ06_02375 [Cytophagales bacterium]
MKKITLVIVFSFLSWNILLAQEIFKGKVIDIVGKNIPDVKISVNNKEIKLSNNEGEFKFFADKNEILNSIDAYKDGLILLDWNQNNNGDIIVTMAPPATIKGKVLSLYKTPLANVKVILTGIPALSAVTTNEDGEFSLKIPQTVVPNQKYRFLILGYASGGGEEFKIDNLQNNFYTLIPKTSLLNNSKDTLQNDERKRAILNERQYFLLQRQSLEKRLRQLQKRYKDVKNPEKLENDIQKIENLLTENKKALAVVQDKAEGTITELLDIVSQTEKKEKEASEKLNKTRSAAELQKTIAQRNITIFIIISISAVIIVLTLILNLRKIRKQSRFLNEKLGEIKETNEVLIGTNEVLKQATIILDKKNVEIQSQKKNLEDFNKNITDSIRYAQTIQNSLLPDNEDLQNLFKEYFVWYQARDIVSGDFYWCHKEGNKVLLAVADCTGHGVPGAFMTMMAMALLNEIIREQHIDNPAEILTLLHKRVVSAFKHQTNRDGDGLDIGLIAFDLSTKKGEFAGAKIPLYIIKNNQLTILKGLNMSIGSTLRGTKIFENQSFTFEENEIFYICSDGVQDQLGYANKQAPRRKFMKTQLMDWLINNHHLDIKIQKEKLSAEVTKWKSKLPQTDDILLFGFRL